MLRKWMVMLGVLLVVAPSDAAPKPRPTKIPLGQFMLWDALSDGARKAYTSGSLTLTFAAKRKPANREYIEKGATEFTFTLTGPDGRTIERRLSGGFVYPRVDFAVGRLDPSIAVPQVIVETFSGGAHCCLTRTVFVLGRAGWTDYPIRYGLNGDADETFPKDVNGDGVADLVLFDDTFAYVFDCFACSWMPPRIFTIRQGAVIDVSASRRYDSLFHKDLNAAKEGCGGKDGGRGACAGVAADGARVGAFEKYWKWVLKQDPHNGSWNNQADSGSGSWGYPTGCRVSIRDDQSCPKGSELKYATYPKALAAFLKRYGYISSTQQRWAVRESEKQTQ